MNEHILDASALLALLNQEPGCELVKKHMPRALMSSVNFSEVLSKLIDRGIPTHKAEEVLDNLKIRIVPFDYKQALLAGVFRTQTKALGLSLGDRACLSLSATLKLPILTADTPWSQLSLSDVTVVQIR